MRFESTVFIFVACVLAAGCQKANPSVTLLGGVDDSSPTNPAPTSAGLTGRVTLGSDSAPHTAAGYALKGRVSFVQPAGGTAAGGYKLQGTVRF